MSIHLRIIRDNLPVMNNMQTQAPFAAAVYRSDTGDRMALLKFVERQKSNGVRIGGVLQQALFNPAGEITGLDAIDVYTGQRIPISRPQQNPDECGLDVAALAETTGVIRQAIDDRLDLVVVEKFGELEQDGKGLIDEIFQTIAAGIPLLIAVPEAALPIWLERTGELGAILSFDEDSFQHWRLGLNPDA